MKKIDHISEIGEVGLIKIIEDLIKEKTGRNLVRDDIFYFQLKKSEQDNLVVFNSDMFVSTTDAPTQMTFYEMGRKSVLMNISDILVKGIKPKGIIISLGIPPDLTPDDFKMLISGIIDYTKIWNLDYIGGDINNTKEIIINPTVFGFRSPDVIIRREGAKRGDFLVTNNKFGLTGVGFDILIKKKGTLENYSKYKRAILSVLEPEVTGIEAYHLANENLASCSIDSSDGLTKSLEDLMLSNPNIGFDIDFNENLIDNETLDYSREYNVNLENLVLNGGEEFIHLFAINPKNYETAKVLIESHGGNLYKIGRVISENMIYLIKESKKYKVTSHGYEHFT